MSRPAVVAIFLLFALGVVGIARAAPEGRPSGSQGRPAGAAALPPQLQRTYRWRGLRVPVGACGAWVRGRAEVLPCGAPQVAAYRARLRGRRRAVRLGGLVALLGAGGWAARARWRRGPHRSR